MIFHSDDNLDPNAVKVIDELEKENNDLRKQNKRYREALMTIAVGDNHFATYEDIAKQALEAEK